MHTNRVAFVTASDDELVDTMRCIDLHNVPEYRLAADLDHWLRPQMRFLGNAGPEATRQYDGPSSRPPQHELLKTSVVRTHEWHTVGRRTRFGSHHST